MERAQKRQQNIARTADTKAGTSKANPPGGSYERKEEGTDAMHPGTQDAEHIVEGAKPEATVDEAAENVRSEIIKNTTNQTVEDVDRLLVRPSEVVSQDEQISLEGLPWEVFSMLAWGCL